MSMSMSSSSSSLLTQSERHAFNAFLSTMSAADADTGPIPDGSVLADWQMYSHLGLPVPQAEGSDSLSKATKDLIALHPPKFGAPHSPQQPHHGHRPIAPAPGPSTPYLLPSAMRNIAHQHTNDLSTPSTSNSNTQTPRPSPSKRARTSHSDSPTSTAAPTRLSPSPPLPPAKTTLLSAQQKKANHIQSEQKRRANIRRGYEALCDTVPALREAIRAEEEGSGNGNGSTGNGGGNSGAGRRKRGKGDDGEKVDGRAGPRSESVVLQKSKSFCPHVGSILLVLIAVRL